MKSPNAFALLFVLIAMTAQSAGAEEPLIIDKNTGQYLSLIHI